VTSEYLACFDGLGHSATIERLAAIKQRLGAAARGELTFDEDLKPVARDPELWEIRWEFEGVQWRLYHGEPALAPGWLIGLRFHRKSVGTDIETRLAQNGEIDIASRRFTQGRLWHWGLP
jgi:hypothetical protein